MIVTDHLQIAAVAAVADQSLVAATHLLAQALKDGGAFGVVAEDIAPGFALPGLDHDLLDLDIGADATGAGDRQRYHWLVVGQHHVSHLGIGAFTGAEDIVDAARLQFGQGRHHMLAHRLALAVGLDDLQFGPTLYGLLVEIHGTPNPYGKAYIP